MFLYVLQVFGVNEEEAVCAARLAGTERRQIITQRSGTRDTGKPAHMETEVQALFNSKRSCHHINRQPEISKKSNLIVTDYLFTGRCHPV